MDASTVALERHENALRRVVCSDPWYWHCRARIEAGHAQPKEKRDDQEAELRRRGVYPPGGNSTAMRRCRGRTCRAWYPPQAVGSSGLCIDCYYCNLAETTEGLIRLASIPSAITFDRRIPDAEADGKGIHKLRQREQLLMKATIIPPAVSAQLEFESGLVPRYHFHRRSKRGLHRAIFRFDGCSKAG